MLRVLGAPQRIVTSSEQTRLLVGTLDCDMVRDAIVPPCIGHDIEPYERDGTVCESSLLDRHWTRVSVSYEPHEVKACETKHTSGAAVFCGLLFHHFGHFLLESTTRLWWPLIENFGGLLVFQNTRPGQGLPDFAARFFRLLGVADRVRVIETASSFDCVIVPHRALVIQKAIHPHFRVPFLRAGQPPARASRPASAFHNVLFSDESRACTYVCRDYNVNYNFFMIDEIMNNESVYVYNMRESEAVDDLSHPSGTTGYVFR